MAFSGNQNAAIRIVGAAAKNKTISHRDLANDFRTQFLNDHTVPITEAIIEQVNKNTFVAHLRHSMLYSFETVGFDLRRNKKIGTVQRNYDLKESVSQNFFRKEKPPLSYSAGAYNFFVGTPVGDYPTAVEMVNTIYNYAVQAGYTPIKVIGTGANLATYKTYLSAGLKAFVSVGHGSPQGILLSDGVLDYNWFNSLSSTKLHPEVIEFNSCQVFNEPLRSSILNHGARTFAGGVTNLAVGPSENVSKCFWNKQLFNSNPPQGMGDTLRACNAQFPNAGTFGIGGDTGPFR